MKRFVCHLLWVTGGLVSVFVPSATAQAPGNDWKQSLSGGFIYGIPVSSFGQNPAPGYTVTYAYRPVHWFALEAGLDQVIHSIGAVEYLNNGIPEYVYVNDHLYFVPFGARFVWAPPNNGRWQVTAGGGGTYLYHHFSDFGDPSTSGFGLQAVASADYALSPSGRFRVGVTARYYYVNPGHTREIIDRFFNIGPAFTFSFH